MDRRESTPEPRRKLRFSWDDLMANSRPPSRPRVMMGDMRVDSMVDMAQRARGSVTQVVPLNDTDEAMPLAAVVPAPVPGPALSQDGLRETAISSNNKRFSSFRQVLADRRVVKYGLSLPVIFVLSVAIGVSYSLAMLKTKTTQWLPQDLAGDKEWTSTTRTHLAQNPLVFLDDLFQSSTIGDDTSVNVAFLKKYSAAIEANVHSTDATFNATWLSASYILENGFAVAGIMAGSFEGYALWPCALALRSHPELLKPVCAHDPVKGWFFIEIFNNLVATTSEKASTYLSLDYTPMSLMSTRIWAVTPPDVTSTGIVLRGYREGTYTERQYWLLKTEKDQLALARVVSCDRSTQSNALECDRLENDNVFVRNVATRDFEPPTKLDKIKVYGPAYVMGNFEAAGKTFVQLPASAIMMASTGYSATTRFGTTIPIRLTITNGKLKTESHVYQVASCTEAVGNGFALATVQLVVVCLIVYSAIAHCFATDEIVAREAKIFGFKNDITMGIIARRLGTYKIVFVQLCVYHGMNVGKYFSAVYYNTQKITDTIAFGAEGLLLVVVSSMLLDQFMFFEKYSSVRETLTVVGSCCSYVAFLLVQSQYFISIHQVQVTERAICAGANQCVVVDGHELYYVGILAALLAPVAIVAVPIHRFVTPTRSRHPATPVAGDELTSFETYCLGMDARREFGCFDRSDGATPLSIVHAAGFTYVGAYLVRIKDYYMVVLARRLPLLVVESCGLTLTVFQLREGRVVAGQHMALVAAYTVFREALHEQYAPIR